MITKRDLKRKYLKEINWKRYCYLLLYFLCVVHFIGVAVDVIMVSFHCKDSYSLIVALKVIAVDLNPGIALMDVLLLFLQTRNFGYLIFCTF